MGQAGAMTDTRGHNIWDEMHDGGIHRELDCKREQIDIY